MGFSGDSSRKFKGTIALELHSSHLGIYKMKSIARSYMWWPGMDSSVEA